MPRGIYERKPFTKEHKLALKISAVKRWASRCKSCHQDEHKKELDKKAMIRYKNNPQNKEKVAARILFNTHVRAGKIKRHPCIVCGERKAQGHHPDYSKPLDVIWLCIQHHADAHYNS